MTSGNKSIAGVENMIFTNKKANDTMKKYTVAICRKKKKFGLVSVRWDLDQYQ